MAYSNLPIGTANPTCFVVLVDQSWSMSQDWGDEVTKADAATRAVNRVLEELVLACRSGENVRDRCHASVIGYGETVDCVVDGMISEVTSALLDVRKTTKLIPDGAGGVIEVEVEIPIWLESRADNGTPMAEAFEQAEEVVQQWCTRWPNGFPPSVINITDGAANDPSEAAAAARKVMTVGTTDGNALVYNLHVTNKDKPGVILPHDTAGFVGDSLAEFLYDISSEMPVSLREEAAALGISPEPNARCFAYNADEAWMIRLLNFGSLQVLGAGQDGVPLPA